MLNIQVLYKTTQVGEIQLKAYYIYKLILTVDKFHLKVYTSLKLLNIKYSTVFT